MATKSFPLGPQLRYVLIPVVKRFVISLGFSATFVSSFSFIGTYSLYLDFRSCFVHAWVGAPSYCERVSREVL